MRTERAGWVTLVLLLAGGLTLTASFDRRAWPALVGDESTYLMAAESLAFDRDLRYAPDEVERFRRHWGRDPDGVILQSTDAGRTLLYAKPAIYPLAIAPFVRLAPTRGPFVANALFLALAAVSLAWALRPALGAAAPWWAAAMVFVSAIPAYLLWAHADLFLAALTTAGLALAWGPAPRDDAHPPGATGQTVASPWRWRWLLAGAALAATGASRWWYLGLVPAGAAGLPRHRRAWLAYGAGAILLLALQVGSDRALRGTWSSYGGERVSFSGAHGFPAVPAAGWSDRVVAEGPGSWLAEGRRFPFPVTARLLAWDLFYFALGAHVGLLPWAPSLLLLVRAGRFDLRHWALVAAFAFAVAGFLLVRPFNFYGGGGAIGNRYILPVLPALWFLLARPAGWPRRPPAPAAAPLVALLGAPLLASLWSAPTAFPFPPGEGYPWVSAVARRFLPYETTQSHLKPSGSEDLVHGGFWIKPLAPGLRLGRDPAGGERLELTPRGVAAGGVDFLLGSPRPVPALCAEGAAEASRRARLLRRGRSGAPLDPRGPGAGTGPADAPSAPRQRLALGWPTARHPMWWSPDDWHLYRVRLEPAAPEAAAAIRLLEACPETR